MQPKKSLRVARIRVKGRFKCTNNQLFDIAMNHLEIRFNTIRLKTDEVSKLINQLLSTSLPWSSMLDSIGLNKKAGKALFLKMRHSLGREKFVDMLKKSKIDETCMNYFFDQWNTKCSKAKKRERDESKSPQRKVKQAKNDDKQSLYSDDDSDDAIPKPSKGML